MHVRQSAFHGTQHQMSNHNLTPQECGVTCLTYIIARQYLLMDGAHRVEAIGGLFYQQVDCRGRRLADRRMSAQRAVAQGRPRSV